MTQTEISNIKEHLLVRHYSSYDTSPRKLIISSLKDDSQLVHSVTQAITAVPLVAVTTVWQALLVLLEHMLKTYHDGTKFSFKWVHVVKHIKTLKLIVELLRSSTSWRKPQS